MTIEQTTEPAVERPLATEQAVPTAQLIAAMVKAREHVSDLVLSPGHAPQVEASGQLVELKFRGLEKLLPKHTEAIGRDLLASSEHAQRELAEKGAADVSYSSSPRSRGFA